jgi:hypothetical protein
MTFWRVTANISGKRIASKAFTSKRDAQDYADHTNMYHTRANARVVKDSEKIRRMLP